MGNKLKDYFFPSKVFPVHTENTVGFREFSPKVELVKVGEKIRV